MPARGAHEISVGKDDVVAGDDLAVAKRELAGGVRAPGDEPPPDHVEATAEDVPAVLVPDDVVDHAREEQRMEPAVLVRVEDEARDRLAAKGVEKGRRLGPRGRRRRRGLARRRAVPSSFRSASARASAARMPTAARRKRVAPLLTP